MCGNRYSKNTRHCWRNFLQSVKKKLEDMYTYIHFLHPRLYTASGLKRITNESLEVSMYSSIVSKTTTKHTVTVKIFGVLSENFKVLRKKKTN
jgi:hypothetical protein